MPADTDAETKPDQASYTPFERWVSSVFKRTLPRGILLLLFWQEGHDLLGHDLYGLQDLFDLSPVERIFLASQMIRTLDLLHEIVIDDAHVVLVDVPHLEPSNKKSECLVVSDEFCSLARLREIKKSAASLE